MTQRWHACIAHALTCMLSSPATGTRSLPVRNTAQNSNALHTSNALHHTTSALHHTTCVLHYNTLAMHQPKNFRLPS